MRRALLLAAGLAGLMAGGSAAADTVRIATFQTGLGQSGPGLFLQALLRGEDPAIDAAIAMAAEARPDILVLQDIDYDAGGAALGVLRDRLAAAGLPLAHSFAARPNSGMATGLDLDGDGELGGPRDAQGYGRFAGAGGMAVLSRWPIGEVTDLSHLLWRDLPGQMAPPGTAEAQRLSSVAHWVVPVDTPAGPVTILTWHGTPPIFDGPEDRNGRRARDETALWLHLLAGDLEIAPPATPLVVLGVANVDPKDGDGRRDALDALLGHPDLTALAPDSDGARAAADPGHRGDPAQDTASFGGRAGNLRVSYLLPSRDLEVMASGVVWPAPDTPLADRFGPEEHWPRGRPVWAELRLP